MGKNKEKRNKKSDKLLYQKEFSNTKNIDNKQNRVKGTFVGVRGRLGVGFFLIVFLYTSLLYTFIFINNKMLKLTDELNSTIQLSSDWENFFGYTEGLLTTPDLNNTLILWEGEENGFTVKLDSLIARNVESSATKSFFKITSNNIYEYLLNKYCTYIIKKKYFSSEQYVELFKDMKTNWDKPKDILVKIKEQIQNKEFYNMISKDPTPLAINLGRKLQKGFVEEQFLKTVNYITDFLNESNSFIFAFTLAKVDIRDRIQNQISFINFSIAAITNLITLAALIFTVFFFFYLQKSLITPIRSLISETDKIGKGDLTGRILLQRSDEIGVLSGAFNTTVSELKFLIQQIYLTVNVISKILQTLFKSSKEVKESANAQATTSEQILGNFEKLDSMIKIITEETKKANSYSAEALVKTKSGLEVIEYLEKEMNKIETSSREITDIINLINDIAEQTELLSLNASIEAARAGESGKGFSVVASEVKKLAEKSTQSANRIYELITYNTKIIQNGVNISKDTGKLLIEIANTNEVSAVTVKTINEEIQKIQQSSNEILGVVNYISEVAQVNLLEIENVANATKDLGDQSVLLQKFIGQFDARSDTIKENQTHIEDILKVKIEEYENLIKDMGNHFFPTGETFEIKGTNNNNYKFEELQIGGYTITEKNDFVDLISKRLNTTVSFYQKIENELICISTTLTNYDNTRATGEIITTGHQAFDSLISNMNYIGRTYFINKWYITIFYPIIDKSNNVIAVLCLGILEEIEATESKIDKKSIA